MNPYIVVSDMMLAVGFVSLAVVSGYRVFKQGSFEPERRHLVPVTVGCVFAAFGVVGRHVWPPFAVLGGSGFCLAVWAIVRHTTILMAQPTMSDVKEVADRVRRVESKVGEILEQVVDDTIPNG